MVGEIGRIHSANRGGGPRMWSKLLNKDHTRVHLADILSNEMKGASRGPVRDNGGRIW